MKKIYFIALTAVIVLIGSVYIVILQDTNNIITDFSSCIKGDSVSDVIKTSELYSFYSRTNLYDDEVHNADVKLQRLLVMHNFHKGVMIVKYNIETFNKNAEHIYGSSNVYATWYIEKKNGTWIVTNIKEKP